LLDARLITAASRDRRVPEQYRALRTRIANADTSARVNVLLVTSAARGDGKTLTAANLALSMASEAHRRVCLVDANLRYPQLHRLFGLPDGPGLCDVLTGHATLDQALVTLEAHRLTILPAGQVPENAGELLGTSAMRRTMEELRSAFDRTLIDAPHLLALADVGILSPLIDKVLLVVRAGVTPKPAIHEAVSSVDAGKLLGVVLNEAV
jgi:capsular exopolysaccharide synthesis family protein